MNDRERLLQWMSQNGISHASLAESVGVTRALISMIATGDREVSGNFKMAFRRAFGNEAVDRVFPDSAPVKAIPELP